MVSMFGSIGFVGLVIPHAMRFIVGVRHARLVPASALAGAVFLIASAIISRIIIPGQVLPIGVITALVGAPAFALLLLPGHVRSDVRRSGQRCVMSFSSRCSPSH